MYYMNQLYNSQIPVSTDLDIDTVRNRINTRREPRFDSDYLVPGVYVWKGRVGLQLMTPQLLIYSIILLKCSHKKMFT